eukprot:3040262-Prymnesium_polylepis.1
MKQGSLRALRGSSRASWATLLRAWTMTECHQSCKLEAHALQRSNQGAHDSTSHKQKRGV